MTSWQKAIKYIAMAFAVLLTVSIIGGILGVLGIFGIITDGKDALTEMKTYEVSQDIAVLKVKISAATFNVKTGESFSVESNLKNLTVEAEDGTLTVTEKSKLNFWKDYNGAALTLYIPEGYVLGTADITTGAGRVTMDTLSADIIRLELGAGEVSIGQLNASLKSKIDGGAGKVTISGGSLRNLDLDMGVGELNLTAAILGSSQLDYGVGEANLWLTGTKADYCIEFNKGVGDAMIDGQKMEDGSIYGDGQNIISIESGVGEVTVNFKS